MKIKNNKDYILIALLLTCLCIFKPAAASDILPYDKIVFFGDSLTDSGNIYASSLGFLPKSPPYHKGRFSNDAIWAEHVIEYFNHYKVVASNYAFGGLTTVLHNPFKGFLPYTLTGAMYDYFMRTLFTDKSTTLFIIWVGSNDYLQGSTNVDQLTTDVVANIKYVVENLIYYGGAHFLIINLPDLSFTPYSKENKMDKVLSDLSQLHNQKLDLAVTELKTIYKTANIHLFDSNKLLVDSLSDLDATNKKYQTNIKNVSQSCWQGGYTLRQEEPSNENTVRRDLEDHVSMQLRSGTFAATPREKGLNTTGFANYIANTPDLFEAYTVSRRVNELGQILEPCKNPDEYTFWDRIHPTAVIHRIFAQNIIGFIKVNY